jgi:hypothetical protein
MIFKKSYEILIKKSVNRRNIGLYKGFREINIKTPLKVGKPSQYRALQRIERKK